MEVGATWHDGQTATPRRVILRADRVRELLMLTDPGNGEVLDSWAFDDIRALRDHGHDRALVVHRTGSEARLVVVGATVISDFRAMVPGLGRVDVDRRAVRRVLWWAGGAAVAMVLLLFVIIPALADRLALWLPPESEQAFGQTMVRQVAGLFAEHDASPFCGDEETEAAFAALTDRLTGKLAGAEGLPYPISVRVLDSDIVNAFAVPGGQVVVLRGLIDEAANGEEVAAVLAHEIGHVIARDPTRIAMRAAGSAGLLSLIFGDVTGGAALSVMTEQLVRASYTRDAEAAADNFALAALSQAGLPTEALAAFFERLSEEHGQENSVVAAFMSHPMLSDRIAVARAAESGTPGAPAFDASAWARLREICN